MTDQTVSLDDLEKQINTAKQQSSSASDKERIARLEGQLAELKRQQDSSYSGTDVALGVLGGLVLGDVFDLDLF